MSTNKHVSIKWQGARGFKTQTASGNILHLDASPEHGGKREGPEPMELLLISLAGCTAMDVLSILEKKRQDISDLRVSVTGNRRDEYPQIYTDISIVYHVSGANIDPATVARSIELSINRYCPVAATLRATATITTHYEIHPA